MAQLYDFAFEETDLAAWLTASGWSASGAPTISSTQHQAGAKSMSFVQTGYANVSVVSPAISKTQVWIRLWVYVTSVASDGAKTLCAVHTSGGDYCALMINNTDRTLRIDGPSAGASLVGNTTTAVALNTWTEIWVTFRPSASPFWEIKIGAETKNSTAAGVTANPITALSIGPDDAFSDALSCYVDTYTADDAAYPTDGGYTRTAQTPRSLTGLHWDRDYVTPNGTVINISNNTANSATYFGSSVTNPPTNTLLLMWVVSGGTVAPTQVCHRFATFTQVAGYKVGTTHFHSWWRAVSGSVVTGTFKVAYAAAQTGNHFNLSAWTDVPANTADNGSSAIIQFASWIGTGVTSGTVTLNSFATHRSSWDAVVAGWGIMVNTNIVAETTYTRIGTGGFATPSTAGMVEWKMTGGDVTPSSSWTGSSPAAGGIALQLASNRPTHTRSTLSKVLPSFALKALGWLVRRASVAVQGLKDIVGQSKSGGAVTVARTASTIAKQVFSVSRLAWHKGNAGVIRPQSSLVRRLRWAKVAIALIRPSTMSLSGLERKIRSVAMVVVSKFSVSRIIRRLRNVSTSITPRGALSRLAYRLRNSQANVSKNFGVARRGYYLRTILSVIRQSVGLSLRRAYVRGLALSSKIGLRVSKLSYLRRAISTSNQISLNAKRIGSYIRRVSSVLSVRALLARLSGATARTARAIIPQTMRVSYARWYVRFARAVVSSTGRVSRIAQYARRLSSMLTLKAIPSRAKAATIRAISLVRAQSSNVRRLSWKKLSVTTNLVRSALVSRIGRYTRFVQSRLSIRALVAKGAAIVRGVALRLTVKVSLKRTVWFSRYTQSVVGMSFGLRRVGSFIRRISSSRPMSALANALRFTGEALLFKVTTTFSESIKHASVIKMKIAYASTLLENVKYVAVATVILQYVTKVYEKISYRSK